MRASVPRSSTSCSGATASAAREPQATSISDHAGSAGSSPVHVAVGVGERLPPAARRVVVVRARVDDRLLLVVLGQVRIRRVAAERELEHDHAGEAELAAQPDDRLRDHAEILGDDGELAELALDRAEHGGARAAPPAAVLRGRLALAAPPSRRRSRGSGRPASGRRARTCGGSARSTSGSRPRASRSSRRAGCPTAGRSPRTGRAARRRRRPAGRGRGCARWSAPSVRDVDRHVAEEAHAALRRVRAQRLPFALEPHLVLDGAAVGDPVVEPVRVAGAERVGLVLGHAARADRRGCRASRRRPRATCRASRSGPSGGPSGRTCHHDCPAAASQSTNANACSSSTPFGNEVGWSRIPEARSSSMRLGRPDD